MDKAQYTVMCYKILENQDWYRQIPENLVDTFQNKFSTLLVEVFYKGILDKNTYEAILGKYPRTPTFYTLPKT